MESIEFGAMKKYPGAGFTSTETSRSRKATCACATGATMNAIKETAAETRQVRVVDICRMVRLIVLFIVIAGSMLQGCKTSRAMVRDSERDPADTFAFAKLGKSVFFGANAFLRSDSSLILVTNHDIYRTSDDGQTWETLAEPLPHLNITAVFATGDTIYAGSGHGVVYRSTDNGLHWSVTRRLSYKPVAGFSRSAVPSPRQMLEISCWPRPTSTIERTDTSVVQIHPSGISRTVTWNRLAEPSAVVMNDTMIVLATRDDGIRVHNLLSGTTTSIDVRLLQGQVISCLALHRDTLFVGTKLNAGGVFRVILGGTSWEQMLVDRIEGALDVQALCVNERATYIASREHGVLAALHGSNIVRSLSDGTYMGLHQTVSPLGSSWVVSSRLKGALMFDTQGTRLRSVSSSAPTSSEYVVTTLDSLIVMGLADGSLYLSSNQGATWSRRSTSFEQSELTYLRTIGEKLYACTINGLFASIDTAKSFTLVTEALRGENVQSVVKTDSLLLVIASSGTYTIDRSMQLGLFTPGVSAEYQIRLNDATVWNNHVFAAGYPGMFFSTNHGQSWELVTIPKVMVLRTATCDGERVYVVGDDGDVYVSVLPKWLREHTKNQ